MYHNKFVPLDLNSGGMTFVTGGSPGSMAYVGTV